jgi:hypothetical protein
VRNPTLHVLLEAFTADAASQLALATATGDELEFELVEADARDRAPRGGRRVPLYCYRPLTADFIRDRSDLLAALVSYAPAARALESLEGTASYVRQRGERQVPGDPRERADLALRCLLDRVFDGRSEFEFDPGRFEPAYEELERALYEGRCVTLVIAPLHGLALDSASTRLDLGEGLTLVRGDGLQDAPPEAVWGEGGEDGARQPGVLVVLRATQERSLPAPISAARSRFRRTLTALRLFESGGFALGPTAWTRVDDGAWHAVALAAGGRAGLTTTIAAEQEDELRAFCNLVARRMPSGCEVAWALSRFEMGCERLAPFEALTDHLLALRALLEPEGPASGRLAQRLAVICARPDERAALAERTAHAISLERAVIAGLAPAQTGVDALVQELAEHLRAILRDVLCGHLDIDVRAVADDLLAEAAAAGA